jgi:hypothetical protein
MSRPALMAIVCVVCALNIVALAVNLSLPSRAAVGDVNYEQLISDPNFTRAVKSIVEACAVNVDLAKVKC